MHKVTQVKALSDYRLWLAFADGTEGTVDLSDLAGKGVFTGWQDRRVFEAVTIGDAGQLCWDGDIDLCPDSLYMKVTGKRPEDVFPSLGRGAVHA